MNSFGSSALGEDSFGAGVVLDGGAELETYPASDRITAPPPGSGAAAPLSSGPLVEASSTVFNVATGLKYVLGLDYFEVLSVSPGEVENVRIPEGTALRVEYFRYESGGVDGTTPAPTLPVSETVTQTRRFATTMKYGG